MNIKWICQSGYILSDGKTEICIDPYLSDVVNRVAGRRRMVECPVEPQNLKSDIVICTHNHLDHLDIDAIPAMNLEKMIFYAPSDCREKLYELGVKNYMPFDVGAKEVVGNFEMEAVFADNTVPAIGVIARYNGKSLYFSGDTYYNARMEKLRNIDYMFIFTTAQIDRNTWTVEMLDMLLEFIKNDPRGEEYRELDWSHEYSLARNGDPNDTQTAL